MADWKTLSTRVAYENPYAYIEESDVINPGGHQTVYGVLKSKADGVYIVPVDEHGNTYLVQQFRYTLKENSWEVPAGRIDGKDFLASAKRELHEETGLDAERFTELATINPVNGMAAIFQKIYLAEGLTATDDALDAVDGILACKKLPIDDVVSMIMNGEIHCPQTITAIFMAKEHLRRRTA